MKNNKGQVFSLDLIIAMTVLVLGIGLLIQFSETRIYEQKENMLWKELESKGQTASALLVSNPEIICSLVDEEVPANTIGHMENCINTSLGIDGRITKENLGLPSEYEFDISGNGISVSSASSANAKNVFSETREVFLYAGFIGSGVVTKTELEGCMSGGACVSPEEITISIWRGSE